MGFGRVLFVGSAKANVGPRNDKGGLIRDGAGRFKNRENGRQVFRVGRSEGPSSRKDSKRRPTSSENANWVEPSIVMALSK
jgi:hypothetical protein